MRTSTALASLLQPLEDVIRDKFIPAIVGHHISDLERRILSLPTRLGGLGISNPIEMAPDQYQASKDVTKPLVQACLQGKGYEDKIIEEQLKAKRCLKERKMTKSSKVNEVMLSSTHLQKRCLEMAQEKGASSWLNALPIKENGFALHKSEFRDALSLRYNWSPDRLPTKCAWGEGFSISHAMDCHTGGFPSRRHNEIRDCRTDL